MKSLSRFSSFALISWISLIATYGDVMWRVSVKIFLDDEGSRPGAPITDADIQAQFDFANTNPYFIGRGLKLEKSEVLEFTVPANASQDWFAVDLMAANNMSLLESEAKANAAYQWRNDKINLYINQGTASGAALLPGSGDIIVFKAAKVQSTPWVFIHEIGHHMSVRHTHLGQNCTDEDKEDCDDCLNPKGGNDDLIADTLSDHKCFDQDGLAQETFGKNYSALTATQQEEVDNTFFNIMSYHGNRSIFTTLQLDAMCDTSNVARDIVSQNNFIFVDAGNGASFPNGLSKSVSILGLPPVGGPFPRLPDSVDAASTGDVLLLRPGNYTEERVIRKAITLRAVRRDMLTPGNATLRAK